MCTICEAPPDILLMVNRSLANGVGLRAISHDCGFSKSALGRHKLRCLDRAMLRSFRDRRKNVVSTDCRFITALENGTYLLQHDPSDLYAEHRIIDPTELLVTDILFRIRYRQHPVRNHNVRAIEMPPREHPPS